MNYVSTARHKAKEKSKRTEMFLFDLFLSDLLLIAFFSRRAAREALAELRRSRANLWRNIASKTGWKKRARSLDVSANGDKSPPRKRAFLREPGDFSSFVLPLPVACENTIDAPPSGLVPQLPRRRNRVTATSSPSFFFPSHPFSARFFRSFSSRWLKIGNGTISDVTIGIIPWPSVFLSWKEFWKRCDLYARE